MAGHECHQEEAEGLGWHWSQPKRVSGGLTLGQETEQRLSLGEDQWSWALVSRVRCRGKGGTAHWSSPSPQTTGLSRGTSGTRYLQVHGFAGCAARQADASTQNTYHARR